MLLERLLRYQDAKKPLIPGRPFCSYWREILRGRATTQELRFLYDLSDAELNEFHKILIAPYKGWTRRERIQMTYMVADLLDISDQRKRKVKETTVLRFMALLDSYEKDFE